MKPLNGLQVKLFAKHRFAEDTFRKHSQEQDADAQSEMELNMAEPMREFTMAELIGGAHFIRGALRARLSFLPF